MPEIGQTISHYRIIEKLGQGGMGEVFRARDTQLNRDVALKVLPADFAADADRLARFQREAQVLASFNHPHIAQIYGLADEEGTRALVMELVEGPTLADRIERGPVPVEEALPMTVQLAEALEYGPRARHSSPRPKALQHKDHARRRRESAGLRACQGARREPIQR